MAQAIPLIDLTPARTGDRAARREAARLIDAACTEIGFFTITGHGVPPAAMEALRAKAHAFFALPLAEKRLAAPPVPGTPRGYIALGIEALSYGNDPARAAEMAAPLRDAEGGALRAAAPDLKEYYHFGRERWPDEPYYTSAEGRRYFIPNLWPAKPQGFCAAAERYYGEMERLVVLLMRLAALGLGLDEEFFADKIDKHITAMRLNFYPALTHMPEPGQLRAGEHTDYGTFTILNGENVAGGLEVRTRGGAWLPVETAPDTFVVNIGDLLMRWTNDRWVSNTHRVVNPPAAVAARAKRLSIAFFHQPNYDALIECIAPPGEAKYPPVVSGAYRDLKYRQTRVA
jgi:isopenicillin N synthase-like dioxygenase